MAEPDSLHPVGWLQRLSGMFDRRIAGIILTLLVELLLLLMLLSLSLSDSEQERSFNPMAVFTINPDPAAEPASDQSAIDEVSASTSVAPPEPAAPAPPQPAMPATRAPTLPFVKLSPDDMRSADIATVPERPTAPAAPVRPAYGPVDKGVPGDSARVSGSGPNGEPLFAASWYREPYDDELSGYLSTASGPGWALIACRTVADFRVDNCVQLSEYPDRSGIGRAVIAAAWQFRVRPPRVGGVSKIGEWVRIRIDYGVRR